MAVKNEAYKLSQVSQALEALKTLQLTGRCKTSMRFASRFPAVSSGHNRTGLDACFLVCCLCLPRVSKDRCRSGRLCGGRLHC